MPPKSSTKSLRESLQSAAVIMTYIALAACFLLTVAIGIIYVAPAKIVTPTEPTNSLNVNPLVVQAVIAPAMLYAALMIAFAPYLLLPLGVFDIVMAFFSERLRTKMVLSISGILFISVSIAWAIFFVMR